MTNREKLNNTNIYDILRAMDIKLRKHQEGPRSWCCIIDLLDTRPMMCWERECDKCIQKWLNEEAK